MQTDREAKHPIGPVDECDLWTQTSIVLFFCSIKCQCRDSNKIMRKTAVFHTVSVFLTVSTSTLFFKVFFLHFSSLVDPFHAHSINAHSHSPSMPSVLAQIMSQNASIASPSLRCSVSSSALYSFTMYSSISRNNSASGPSLASSSLTPFNFFWRLSSDSNFCC